ESKACIIDENLKIIRTAIVPHTLSIPYPGWAEHDAENVWWHDCVQLCRELLDNKVRAKLLAVGCSAIAPTVLPVDARGFPLRPAILYGIDTRAYKEITEIEEKYGIERIKEKCWNALSTQSAGPKILWFIKNEPALYKKTWKIMTATTYLVFKLTKAVVIDKYTAGAFSPMFNMNTLDWDEELAIVPRRLLPELKWTTEIAGKVTKEAAAATKIPEGTPVVVGTADAAAEFVSAGGGTAGDLMIMLGSTVFFIEQLAHPPQSTALWNSVFLWPECFCIAGGMATGGALTRWFRDNFADEERLLEKTAGINAYESLWKRSAEVPAGGQGLLVFPYFSGERTPLNDPAARGVILGLSLFHSKYHVYRALLEGIAFGIRHNLEYIDQVLPPKRILVAGGGTKNQLWLKIIASIIARKLLVPPIKVGASYGDAILAAIGINLITPDVLPHLFHETYDQVDPEESLTQVYEQYYHIYRNAWDSIKEWVHKLAHLGGARNGKLGRNVA
ncbi:MAG: FGGY family carbohydrate kinase, partial [Thermosphaera sp.]